MTFEWVVFIAHMRAKATCSLECNNKQQVKNTEQINSRVCVLGQVL